MAIELMDEIEQGEIVRNWLKQNLSAIVIGVLGGIGLIIGWQQFKGMKQSHAGEAQAQYLALAEAIEKKDADATAKLHTLMRDKYSDTPYAVFAALNAAREAVARGDTATAEKELTWARDQAEVQALGDLATMRLARVKLAKGDAKGAVDLVTGIASEAYKALAAELRGDALVVLKREAEAVAAYDEALTAMDATAANREFVQMKRDDIANAGTGT